MKRLSLCVGVLAIAFSLKVQAASFTDLAIVYNGDYSLTFKLYGTNNIEPWYVDINSTQPLYWQVFHICPANTLPVSIQGWGTTGRWPWIYRAHQGYLPLTNQADNVVGNYDQEICNNETLTDCSNPFDRGNNMVSSIFKDAPLGTLVSKYDVTNSNWYTAKKITSTLWLKDFPANPGVGLVAQSTNKFQLVTYGTVRQGNLTTTLSSGLNLVSSQFPKTIVTSELPLVNGDKVYAYDNGTTSPTEYRYNGTIFLKNDGYGNWVVTDAPSFYFGRSFWIEKVASTNWLQTNNAFDTNITDMH